MKFRLLEELSNNTSYSLWYKDGKGVFSWDADPREGEDDDSRGRGMFHNQMLRWSSEVNNAVRSYGNIPDIGRPMFKNGWIKVHLWAKMDPLTLEIGDRKKQAEELYKCILDLSNGFMAYPVWRVEDDIVGGEAELFKVNDLKLIEIEDFEKFYMGEKEGFMLKDMKNREIFNKEVLGITSSEGYVPDEKAKEVSRTMRNINYAKKNPDIDGGLYRAQRESKKMKFRIIGAQNEI